MPSIPIHRTIVRPVITEKSSAAYQEHGEYTFEVHPEATKPQIRVAIEQLFGVKVTGVWTSNQRGKEKRMGRTTAPTPCLFRLKSMIRYFRLCPPPRRRIEMWPWLSRPAVFFSGSTSDFSGVVRVISVKSGTARKRVPFVTGLN